MSDSMRRIEREVTACRRCPRLVSWREEAGHAVWSRVGPLLSRSGQP